MSLISDDQPLSVVVEPLEHTEGSIAKYRITLAGYAVQVKALVDVAAGSSDVETAAEALELPVDFIQILTGPEVELQLRILQ